jgi:hypothetical protein
MSPTEYPPLEAELLAYYNVSDGLCYPGLASGVKSYIWKTAVCSILTSGCHAIDICAKDMSLLEAFESKNIKRIFGLPLRSHHKKVLMAMASTF